MKKIIVVTHGKMAEAMVSAARGLVGASSGVSALNFEEWQSVAELRGAIKRELGEKPDDDIFILTDFLGGSPSNCACAFLINEKIRVISGVNMPMLVELILKRDKLPADKVVDVIIKAGRDSIADVGEKFRASSLCEEEDSEEESPAGLSGRALALRGKRINDNTFKN